MTLTYPEPFYGLPRILSHAFATLISPVRDLLASFIEGEDSPADEPEVVSEEEDEPELTLEEIEARQKRTTERLFGSGDDDPKPPKKDKEPKKGEEKAKSKEKPAPKNDKPVIDEDADVEPDEDPEVDYEAEDEEEEDGQDTEDEGSEEEDEEGENDEVDDTDPADEPDPAKRETLAQKQAKEFGRKAKRLENELITARLELTNKEEALREAQSRIAEFSKVRIDPTSTPEYKTVNEEMWKLIDEAVAEDLPRSASGLPAKFNSYMREYLATDKLTDSARSEAIDKLRERIVKDLGDFEYAYTDLIDEEKRRADTLAKDVLKVLRNAKPKALELIAVHSKLEEQAKSGRLDFSASEHARAMKEYAPTVAHLGKMDDELVEKSPYAPEAVVAQLAKKSPKLAAKLESAKNDVLEIVIGLKPLSSKDYDKLEEEGVDIAEYEKNRKKAHAEKKRKLLPLLVRGLFSASITNKSLETLVKKEREEREKGDEFDALDEIERDRKKKVETKVPAKKKVVEIDPRKRPNPISKYF